MGPVVSQEHDQRVFANSEFLQFADDSPDEFVHVLDHVGEVLVIHLVAIPRFPCGAVGRRREGKVRQVLRVIDEERLFTVPVQEIAEIIYAEVRPVVALLVLHTLPDVVLHVGICVRIASIHVVLVEPRPIGRCPAFSFKLPLSGNTRGVARVLHHVAEGELLLRQAAEPRVVAEVVPPGHQRNASGRAERVDEAMREANASALQVYRGVAF